MRSALVLVATLLAAGIATAGAATAAPLEPRPQRVIVAHHPVTDNPVLGPRHALVTVDFFMILGNSRSQQLHEQLALLRRRHPRRVRVIYRLVTTERYRLLTEAAMEAFAQSRFEPFLAVVFAGTRPPRTEDEILAACDQAGVQVAALRAAWADGRHGRILERNDIERQRRTGSLPGLLLNGMDAGRAIARDSGAVETLYREALALARARMARGVPVEHLYHASLRALALAAPPLSIEPSAVDGMGAGDLATLDASAPLLDQSVAVPGHVLGPDDAAVVAHLYCNFLSSNCALIKRSFDHLRQEFPDRLRLVFHHMLPDLDGAADEDARRRDLLAIHRASLCAAEQDAFWDFYEITYRDYLTRRHRQIAVDEQVRNIARDLASAGLNQERFEACLARDRGVEAVEERVRAARRAGIVHTPTVVIGGRIYPGIKTPLELRTLVVRELLPGVLEQGLPTWDGADRAAERLAP